MMVDHKLSPASAEKKEVTFIMNEDRPLLARLEKEVRNTALREIKRLAINVPAQSTVSGLTERDKRKARKCR